MATTRRKNELSLQLLQKQQQLRALLCNKYNLNK